MSHPWIWIVMLVNRVQNLHWGSIHDRRTSRGRLYHWATAIDGGVMKLSTVELRTGCRIYATFLSTQVRVLPGARNFCRPKFISFSPFKWERKVNVELYATYSLKLDNSKWKSWAIRDLQIDSRQKRRWKLAQNVNLQLYATYYFIFHKNANGK